MRIVLLAILCVLVGCRSAEDRAAYHIERGKTFVAEDKLAAAKIEFRSALTFAPKSVVANLELADLAEDEANRHDAIFYLREVLSADPSNRDVMLRLATLLRDDEPWRARQLLLTSVAEDPDDPVAHLGLSQLELSIGQHDEALASAKRAIELDPTIPGSYWQLGIIYESLIERATKLSPVVDDELRDNAVKAFEDFVTQGGEPEWKARLEQARVLGTDQRGHARAINAAKRALEVARRAEGDQPKLLAAQHLSTIARTTRDRAAYADATEVLLEVTPGDFYAWKNLAELRDASGGSGEKVYRELLSLYPYDPDAHALYARYIGLTQGYFAAVAYFEKVIGEGVDPPRLLSTLRTYQIAYRMKPHADRTLERMRAEFPGNPWTRLEEAKLRSLAGESVAVIEELEALVEEVEIPEAYETLARLESFRRRPKRAVEHAQRAVVLTGYYEIRLHRLLAQALFDAGMFREHLEAIDVIEKYEELTQDQLFSKALSLYETGEGESGGEILLQLAEDPETQITSTVEFARREMDNPQQVRLARRLVLAALAQHPDDQDLVMVHVDVNLAMGRADLALGILDDLKIALYPSRVRYLRAQLRAKLGNFDGAMIDLSYVLRTAPSLPGLLDFTVSLYSSRGVAPQQIPKVAGWIDIARNNTRLDWLTNSRRIAYLQLLMSRLLHTLGRNDEAASVLERAIANYEFIADTRIDLTYLLALTNRDLPRAIEIAEQVADVERPDPRALDALGFAYLTAEQPLKALESFRRANETVSNSNALFLYHESMALRDLGREEDALEAINRVIALDPTFREARTLRKALLSGGTTS